MDEDGVFLDMDDCKALFLAFKKDEANLSDAKRDILRRIEKLLYARLTVQELEDLYE
ncbi:hypothetical protein [Leadbettera azotonutricia]|uniref:Uncharacterized protein n=1 Tax=Leadbettera azotonutricia (strain ATCC BAA-888 / DSM 13862 / ZAS-9) TaxID=545695 RepID=F5YC90_LEAAZ|nr:hypothetical protein [Leadbettera azotonutricia]AEF80854.1 hypothetical protein TREAZ_0482 [Leadbettera azotonutricia ZAS-9]